MQQLVVRFARENPRWGYSGSAASYSALAFGCQPARSGRDAKFTRAFDDAWRSTGTEIIRTPVQAPNANAVAECWVGTVRRECLDQLLIVGRQQLVRVLRRYVEHYNQHRPHRSLAHATPVPSERTEAMSVPSLGRLRRRDVLGGLIHEYESAA